MYVSDIKPNNEDENSNVAVREKIEFSDTPLNREGSILFSRMLLYAVLGLAIGISLGNFLFSHGSILLGVISIVIFPTAGIALSFYVKNKIKGSGSWVLSLIGWICIVVISSFVACVLTGK